jgi:hypothetical protein
MNMNRFTRHIFNYDFIDFRRDLYMTRDNWRLLNKHGLFTVVIECVRQYISLTS